MRFLQILAAIFGVILLTACNEKPERPVSIGTNVWPGYEPGYVAATNKLYGEADVSIRQFRSATEVMRAFRNQALDVAALTLDEAIQLHQGGVDIRIILVTDISNGADVIMARPPIDTVRELSGLRIGVENSALGAYMIARALQVHGLKPADVTQVSLTVDETVDYFKTGKVDAVVTFEPFKSQLAKLGARTLFDSSEIPDEIVDVLVVRAEFAEANPNALKAVVKGWLDGASKVKSGDPKVVAEMAARLGMTLPDLKTALRAMKLPGLQENRGLLSGEENPLSVASMKLVPLLEERNKARISFNPAQVLTPDFLAEAAQ